MINWLRNWKKRRSEREFQNGYEFAAGVLLKSGDGPVIKELEDRASTPFDYQTTFDLGVLGAVRDYRALIEGETLAF
jgi:hypothetical protein